MLNVIIEINESKTLTKHISCVLNVNLMGQSVIQINGRITINTYVNVDIWKRLCEKDYVWNPATFNCENRKYLASIMDKITCDKIIGVEETNFDKKGNITCKTQNLYIILAFLLITISLLIAVSIYCYLRKKYKAKQKHLVPFNGTNIYWWYRSLNK